MWGMYGAIIAKRRAAAKELVSKVVGMPMRDAVQAIKDAELEVQFLEVDGVPQTAATQFKPERLGLVVAKGVVTGAQIG